MVASKDADDKYDGTLLASLIILLQWSAYFGNPTGNTMGLIAASFYFRTSGDCTKLTKSQNRSSRCRVLLQRPLWAKAILVCWGVFCHCWIIGDMLRKLTKHVHRRPSHFRMGCGNARSDRPLCSSRTSSPRKLNVHWPADD